MSFWEKVKLLSSEVFKFLLPFVKQFLTRAGRALLPIAAQAVRDIAHSYVGADGETKRKAAIALVKHRIEEVIPHLASEIGDSMINSAIEAAVRNLKS